MKILVVGDSMEDRRLDSEVCRISQEAPIPIYDINSTTPYAGGAAFAKRWAIPRENLFVSWQGHFSVALGLARDPRPVARLAELLRA